MSEVYYLREEKGGLQEVTEHVFKVRKKCVTDKGDRRYTDEHWVVKSGQVESHGVLDAPAFAALGRALKLEVKSTNPAMRSSLVEKCPEYVIVQMIKNKKPKLLQTSTGKFWNQ